MDELRFLAQQSPRTQTPMNTLVSPPRNGNRLSQPNSHDPRTNLPRRFTTESGRVPTLSSIVTTPQRVQEPASDFSVCFFLLAHCFGTGAGEEGRGGGAGTRCVAVALPALPAARMTCLDATSTVYLPGRLASAILNPCCTLIADIALTFSKADTSKGAFGAYRYSPLNGGPENENARPLETRNNAIRSD